MGLVLVQIVEALPQVRRQDLVGFAINLRVAWSWASVGGTWLMPVAAPDGVLTATKRMTGAGGFRVAAVAMEFI